MNSFKNFLFFMALPLFAQISFQDWAVNSQNQLVMHISAETENSLFSAAYTMELETKTVEPLSFYPEKMYAAGLPSRLLLVNRLGVFLADEEFTRFAPLSQLPSFPHHVQTGVLEEPSLSPNGAYLIFIRGNDGMKGELVLIELDTGALHVVSKDVPFQSGEPPVLWDPQSRLFLYEKDHAVYSFFVDLYKRGTILAESQRKLGDFTLAAVSFDRSGAVYFSQHGNLYRIPADKMFVTTNYADYLAQYVWLREFPFEGDPHALYVSSDGRWVALSHSEYAFTIMPAQHDAGNIRVNTQLSFAAGEKIEQAIWSRYNVITIVTRQYQGATLVRNVYSFLLSDTQGWQIRKITHAKRVHDVKLSRLGSYIAVFTELEGVNIYRHRDWDLVQSFSDESYHTGVWISDTELALGGPSTLAIVDVVGNSRIIGVSQPKTLGFLPVDNEEKIVMELPNGSSYIRNTGGWIPATERQDLRRDKRNRWYATTLYLSRNYFFRNNLLIHDLRRGNRQFFPSLKEDIVQRSATTTRAPVRTGLTRHGPRHRAQVAIVFNVAQRNVGLNTVLYSLLRNDLQATFFLNGDFMRRFPHLTRSIADMGHEVGSLFDTYVNFSDARYHVTPEYIREGLTSSQRMFSQVTGRALAELWHSPYYVYDASIVMAAASLGFQFIGREFDADPVNINIHQMPADRLDEIVDSLLPGSIISLTAGMSDTGGPLTAYSLQYLDILIKRIKEAGYEIVTVSELLQKGF